MALNSAESNFQDLRITTDNSWFRLTIEGDAKKLTQLIKIISLKTNTVLTDENLENFMSNTGGELNLAGDFNIKIYRTNNGITVGLHPSYMQEVSHEIRNKARKAELQELNNRHFEKLQQLINESL